MYVMRVWRAHYPPEQQRVFCCSHVVLKWVLVWVSVCFLVFTVGPPSKWRLKDTTTSSTSISTPTQSPCPQCECYCSSSEEYPQDLFDCGKDDPAMNEEMNKDILTMLSEELTLQKIVANETLEHTKRLIMDSRKTFSQYQKEAEKCNLGVETCEAARERAEAELIEELRLSALWENRAREYGWKDISSS
ncbi:hypothetical protein RIF29_24407 [Crotalaria pallida]|uniref:Uncharacterized protein n=1 Tax=Crotalaria pallida TaxID=3830 RepID=A0AAN9I051_CROPI